MRFKALSDCRLARVDHLEHRSRTSRRNRERGGAKFRKTDRTRASGSPWPGECLSQNGFDICGAGFWIGGRGE